MNWGGFYSLSAAWLAAMLVPLVVFYFLKLKRPRLDVPSLVLWRQVLQDSRVNSPFQKFKRNLLLLLQILLLLLLILAAMQPFWRGRVAGVERLPVVIDASASMAALDQEGGETRLAEAKRRVGEMIDGLGGRQELCLITLSRTPRKRTGFTGDKRVLREALAGIEADDVPGDLEEALRLVQALGRSEPFDEVMLFTDGNLPARANFDLSFQLRYQQVAEAGANLGISACSARRAVEGGWDVFAQIEGSVNAEGTGWVELLRENETLARERITITPGRAQRLVFRVPGERAAVLQLLLKPDAFDSLPSDNVVYLDLPAVRPLRVFAPKSLVACRHALRGLAGIDLFPQETGDEAAGSFDLVISDRTNDWSIAARSRLMVGLVPPELQPLVVVETNGTEVVDWRRDAALLRHVGLAELVILDQPAYREGVGEGDLENQGYEVLVHGHRGPLLVEKRENEHVSWALLFHPDRSTWPYRVGFPVFLANGAQAALQQAGLADAPATPTGLLPPMTVAASRTFRITAPDGSVQEQPSDERGQLAGVVAPRVGRYGIAAPGGGTIQVGASLLSPSETSLARVDRIEFREDLAVSAGAPVKTDRALWGVLTLLAFVLLLVEWWFFQRRPGGAG